MALLRAGCLDSPKMEADRLGNGRRGFAFSLDPTDLTMAHAHLLREPDGYDT